MDLLATSHAVTMSTKHIQKKDHFKVNNAVANLTTLPALPTATHGQSFYNKTFTPNTWCVALHRAALLCARCMGGPLRLRLRFHHAHFPLFCTPTHHARCKHTYTTTPCHTHTHTHTPKSQFVPLSLPPLSPPPPHTPSRRWWGNNTYNDTKFTLFVDGRQDAILRVAALACPDGGCNSLPEDTVDVRAGLLLWSNSSIWPGGIKPVAGQNVGCRLGAAARAGPGPAISRAMPAKGPWVGQRGLPVARRSGRALHAYVLPALCCCLATHLAPAWLLLAWPGLGGAVSRRHP